MSKKIIGVYPMFNTGGICVHAIDDAEDKVLASVNGRRDLHGITTSALMKNLTLLPTSATRFMSCWKHWSLLWSALCRAPTALCGISSPVRS